MNFVFTDRQFFNIFSQWQTQKTAVTSSPESLTICNSSSTGQMSPTVSCYMGVLLTETQKRWKAENLRKLLHHLNLEESCIRTGFISTVVGIIKKSSEISNNAWDCCLPNHMSEISRSEKWWSQIFHFGEHSVKGSVKTVLGIQERRFIFHSSGDVASIFKLILDSSC